MFVVELLRGRGRAVRRDRGQPDPTPRSWSRPLRQPIGARRSSIIVGDRTVRLISLGGPATRPPAGPCRGEHRCRRSTPWRPSGAPTGRARSRWWPPARTRQFAPPAGGGPAAQWADIAAVAGRRPRRSRPPDRGRPADRVRAGRRRHERAALRIVLSHELFHYAARADTALDAPRWLTEGVADYVAPAAHPAARRCAPLPTALPSDADLVAPGTAALAGLRPRMVVRPVRRRHLRGADVARALPGRLRRRPRRRADAVPRRARHRPGGRTRRLAAVAGHVACPLAERRISTAKSAPG